jgi:hypothetical protein
MAQYLLTWQEVDTINLVIEADNKRDALNKWISHDFDSEDAQTIGVELDEESLEIEII